MSEVDALSIRFIMRIFISSHDLAYHMITLLGSGFALMALILSATIPNVYAQELAEVVDLGNGTRVVIVSDKTNSILPWESFWFIVVTFSAAIATAILTPLARERYKIREQYLVPYRTWCISFSGMLHEFYELCKFIDDKEVTNIDVIVHVWSMHAEVEKGFRWLNVVKKDDPTVGKALDELMDAVDELWHKLQDKHSELLARQATNDDLYIILEKMSIVQPDMIEKIAEEMKTAIRGEWKRHGHAFDRQNLECILDMLKKKVPHMFPGLRDFFTLKHVKLFACQRKNAS